MRPPAGERRQAKNPPDTMTVTVTVTVPPSPNRENEYPVGLNFLFRSSLRNDTRKNDVGGTFTNRFRFLHTKRLYM